MQDECKDEIINTFNIHVVIVPTWKKFLGEFSRFGEDPRKRSLDKTNLPAITTNCPCQLLDGGRWSGTLQSQ